MGLLMGVAGGPIPTCPATIIHGSEGRPRIWCYAGLCRTYGFGVIAASGRFIEAGLVAASGVALATVSAIL